MSSKTRATVENPAANDRISFYTDSVGASFSVLSTTNLFLPLTNWTVLGVATNTGSGVFQFTTATLTNEPQRFYGVRVGGVHP